MRTMRLIAIVALAVGLVACTTIRDLAHGDEPDPKRIPGGESRLLLVDVREDGELVCPGVDKHPVPCTERLERVRHWLSTESTTAPIVVFVHGWHHNASHDDENLKGFKAFLLKLEDRRRQAGVEHPAVDGIYVGWRGDAWEFAGPKWIQFLDFPTIWLRKAASVRVGEGGLRTLVSALRAEYPGRVLIVAGHSLGASAIFHAVKLDLHLSVESGQEFILMNPAVSEQEFDALATRVRAAVRAARSESRVEQFRKHRVLMVLQALDDWAIGTLYAWAFPGVPVGFDDDKRTHNARMCESDCPQPSSASSAEDGRFEDPGCYHRLPGETEPAMVITAITRSGTCEQQMDNPVWVVTGEAAVSRDHNDIFNDPQAAALAAHIERAIVHAERRLALRALPQLD